MTKVTHDLFRIATRLLKINPAYTVYFNTQKDRFEVHAHNSIAFVVPYELLDSRTLEYALKTRVQNADIIDNEIALHNEQIVTTAKQNIDKAAVELKDMLSYANRTGHTVAFTKNYVKEF